MEISVFRAGIPTAPDVRKLRERFPGSSMQGGDCISYADIEQLIGCAAKSSRFRTVTTAWRRSLLQCEAIILKPLRGQGLTVLKDNEKLELAADTLDKGMRQVQRSMAIAAHINTDNLTEVEKTSLSDLQTKVRDFRALEASKRPQHLPTM